MAILLLALTPAVATAQRVTLQNSGLDEYTEDVPETGGDGGSVDGGGGNGGDGASGNAASSGDSASSSSDPTASSASAGTGTSSASAGGDAPSEAEVTSGSGRAPRGELAATGLETLGLALAGAGLLALGFYVRKAATT